MANTNATYATSISVDLPDYPAAVVTFTNTAFFVSGNSEVLPGKQYSLTLDSSGQGTQTLPCPDNTGDLAINWRINLPSKESGTYAIAYSAITQNLSDILAAQSTTADPDVITAALAAKANKVTGATADNLASLDANGDLQDSGFAAADFDVTWLAAATTAAAAGAQYQIGELDGDLNLAFTVAPRGYFMQATTIAAGETVTVPSGHQMLVFGDFAVDGDLVAVGDLVSL